MVPVIVHGDLAGGPIIASHQQWVRIMGKLVVVVPDNVTPHDDGEHEASPHMVQGSSWLSLQGFPVCRLNDLASCGHPAQASQTWFSIA